MTMNSRVGEEEERERGREEEGEKAARGNLCRCSSSTSTPRERERERERREADVLENATGVPLQFNVKHVGSARVWVRNSSCD
jgi:xanthine dehydrogenase iron-sulfur cluster and FAD-binding subunit A